MRAITSVSLEQEIFIWLKKYKKGKISEFINKAIREQISKENHVEVFESELEKINLEKKEIEEKISQIKKDIEKETARKEASNRVLDRDAEIITREEQIKRRNERMDTIPEIQQILKEAISLNIKISASDFEWFKGKVEMLKKVGISFGIVHLQDYFKSKGFNEDGYIFKNMENVVEKQEENDKT